MVVRLDEVPPLAPRPTPPKVYRWLVALVAALSTGFAAGWFFSEPAQTVPDARALAVAIPSLIWCALLFSRALWFVGKHRVADGWDRAREADMARQIQRGKRSQQVLAISVQTALRAEGDQADIQQLEALLQGRQALKTQAGRVSSQVQFQSLLNRAADSPEELVLDVLTQTLSDIAKPLALLPAKTPLTLVLETSACLDDSSLQAIWQQAWDRSEIRQPVQPFGSKGLVALDEWLDLHISDQALLLIVALQLVPDQAEGKGEVAVGLLLGNRLTQNTLEPMAHVHRPEQERTPSVESLAYASRQALKWAPLAACDIKQFWKAGIATPRSRDVSSVVEGLSAPAEATASLCNLDALLGDVGPASCWLAIAAAAQAAHRGAGPQLVFTGDSALPVGIWGTVIVPSAKYSE
jgi:hypothetical protein